VSANGAYDPKVIERFADQLLRRADSTRVGFAAVGGIFGVIVGAVPLTPLESVWPIPATFGVATVLLGGLVGVLVGWVVGEGRAFRYRVEAQRALFQVEIERRVTSAVTEAVAGLVVPNAVQAADPAPVPIAVAAPQRAPLPSPTPPTPPPPPVELPPAPAVSSVTPVPSPLRPPGPPLSEPPEAPPLSPAVSA
jgi:hypothetical protein